MSLTGHLAALLGNRLDARVNGEALGDVDERVSDALEDLGSDSGGEASRWSLVEFDGLGRFGLELLEFTDLVEDPFELALVVAKCVFGFLERDVTAADEGLGVALTNAALGVDDVVHGRLGHRRVVALVVTATAVADEVDDNVLAELLTEVDGQLSNPDASLGVVAVDVEGPVRRSSSRRRCSTRTSVNAPERW